MTQESSANPLTGTPAAPPPHFPSTEWSLIGRAARQTSGPQRAALAQVLQRYLPALRAHLVIERRIPPEQADDLLQSFVSSKILEQRLIDRSDRDRGKFRTFLLRALNNFAIDQHRKGTLERRMVLPTGQAAGAGDAEQPDPLASVPDDELPPGAGVAFDQEWARRVIDEAVERMRADCRASDRMDIWGVFDLRVLGPCLRDEGPVPYDELIERFHFASPAQASNVLMTAKRAFARQLRAVVGEYAPHTMDVFEELSELKRILAGTAA